MNKYMMWICTITVFLAMSAEANAQEHEIKAKKMGGKTLHRVVMIKFKPAVDG